MWVLEEEAVKEEKRGERTGWLSVDGREPMDVVDDETRVSPKANHLSRKCSRVISMIYRGTTSVDQHTTWAVALRGFKWIVYKEFVS